MKVPVAQVLEVFEVSGRCVVLTECSDVSLRMKGVMRSAMVAHGAWAEAA